VVAAAAGIVTVGDVASPDALLKFHCERRRFPPPWDIEERNAACFIVMDANRFPVCYVYFESEPDGAWRRT
jgi:hypothetical protein